MENLTSKITQGWTKNREFGTNRLLIQRGDETIAEVALHLSSKETESNFKAIALVPKLLGLVDVLSQRLEEKYKNTLHEDIPWDEVVEILACREIKKAME